MRNHFKYTFTTIFLLFFVQLSVNASRGDKTSSIHTPIGGSPVMTGTATAIDSVELDPLASNQRDYNVRNRISFGVDMQYPKFVSRKQRVEVSVNVKQFDENNTALSDLNFKLNIAYNHRDTLKSIILDDYEFSDAYKIIFKIDTIRVNGDLATTLPENLFVQGDVFVERYSELSTTTIFGNPIQFLDVDCNNSYDGIHFSWPDFQGAEEYQLEFMHVSDYGVNGSVKPEASLNYDFRNNSTRITTSKTFYNIGLLFDRGWIAYRVRPVGVDINDPSHLIFGEWSVATTKSTLDNIAHLYKIQITNAEVHEDSLNWQYSATYAEQGKRKEVITYYDGTLRNRQAVTKVNTDNNVIVGETIYDHQGRPAVNILPTPVEIPDCNLDAEPTIKYYSDYNLNSQGEPYSKTDFDLSAIDECSIGADSMSTTNGASQYYSPSNPNQNLHQAFVPDAEGYPFQQVEYTPDNTGRINRQSGVGPNFKLGSGKESQYLYGNPNQLELNKLFGSEVGYSNHYQKNAVIDANGQVSVSYIDISGKVIATALAGEAPQNMEGLGADPEEFFEVNHISSDGSNQVFDDLSNTIIYSASFVVTSPTLAVVDYQMYTLPLVDSCLENICIDCVYELELSLKDDCGVDLLPDTLQNTTVGNFQIDSLGNYVFHEQCSDTTKFNSYNEVYLDIGKYTVSKTLKIKEEAVLSYLDLIDSSNCVLNYEDFLANEMQFIDSTACMITCDNCIDELGTLQNFITTGQGSSSEYHLRVEECKKLCEEKVSDCEMYLTLMEIDFSIGGQYAQYLNNTTGALDLNKPLSIFNTNNLLPNSNASWRNPVLETSNGIQYIYVDGNGERSKVILSLDTTNPNVFSPVPQNNNLVQYDSLSGEYYIYPEQLQSVEDFIDLFEPSWSSSLVVYHPEYCYYETCLSFNEKNTSLDAFSSQTFDDLLLNTHTFSEAQAFGFIDAGGNLSNWFQPSAGDPTDSIIPWDPFVFYSSTYETGVCAGYANNLVTKFNQFEFQFGQWYSMAEIAAYTVRCGSSLSSVPAADCYNFGQAYNGIMDTTILNGEWRILKALYMSAKQEAQQDLADCKAIAYCSSFNNCIGDVDYTPFPLFGYIQLGQNTNYYPFIDDSQPCSVFSSHLYRYKVKRFSNHDDAMKEDANSTSYELYLQTGQCPNAFSLQHLLNDLAITNNLTASNYNLNLNNFLTALFQSNNSYNNPGTIPSLEYTATVTPNTISADWIDNSNSSTFATMTLNKTVPQNWNDVTGIINLFATGPNSFSAEATYIDTIVKVFPITGTITHFNLDGCTFEQECVSNQLALDLTTVFNILGNDNNLFSTTPIDIENYVSTSIGSTIGLTSLYIENAAGVGSNLSWEFLGSGKVRIFDASVSGNDGLYIEMDQTVFEPSILSTIDGFYPMTTTGNYSFEIDAILNPGGLVPITGVMYQIHNGDTLGISTGNCDLPIPNSCQGIDYEVFADLEPLLENALINYDGVSNIDLFANIFTTPAIVAAFPFGETQTTSTNTGDSLIISAGECDIIISMNTPQVGQFENLIAIEQLELIGDLNAQSGYNNFVFIGTFATAAQNVQDTVYVSTCFSLKECNPCYDSEVDSINTLYSFLRPYEDVLTINNQRGFSYLKSDNQTQFIENEIMNSQSNTSNCEHNYFVLNNCIDNFNTLGYPVFLEYLTYGELENNGLCDCIDYICSMLYTIVYDSIVLNSSEEIYTYIFNEIECGKCYDNFNQYQQCINNFNTNYLGDYGFTSEDIIPDAQTFNNLFSCDCADTYCELLDSIVAQNIQFETQADFSEFVDYYRNCKGCKAYYSSYLSDVESFNVNSHTFLISPMSEVLFVANNYCDCLKTYTRHINEIIDSTMQFNSKSEFDNYTHMNRVCKDEKINIQENHCEDAYTQYMDCGINYVTTSTLPFQLDFLSFQDFDSLQLCFCVDSYCSALDAALAGIVTFNSQSEFNDYIFGALNCNKTPPCSPSPASGVFPEMPTVELENDCIETQVNLAVINAQNAYNQYVDSLKTVQSAKYINHCMVTQEALYTNYNDKQHHYTLYYYDVAGNLIKTIPPEGVQLLPIMSSNDSINIQINNDRNSGTKTVFTTHRLQTRYEYNSLNQLVAQYTPDTDPMESFEETLPNGLNNKLITHKIQMINASLGYLAGSVGERGYLYKTTDGGKTWQRQHKLVGADLKKTVMIDAIYGVAIGELGTVLKTSDGGTSWDLLNTWTINGMITSLNDVAFINSGSSYEVMIVGNNGLAALSSNFTTSSPTFTVVNSGLSGNVLSVESMSSTFYCTAHDPSLEVSRFYSYSTSTWTEIEKVNTNSFTDVHFYESNKAYATDTDGRIFRNTDVSGTETHWKHRSSNLNDSIKKIRFFNEQQGAAIAIVNGNKRLLFTKDAAKTWEALSDSSYFDIAISDNNSVIAAASKNGRVSLIFPYVSGTHQIAKVETPLLYGELTSIWVEESTSGSIHIMLTDERYLRYTENGLVVNPNWEISNYNSTTGSFIKELIATTNSSGNLYGLAITNSGQAWKLKKEIAPFVEIAGQVAGSNYKKAVLGDAYFYTLSSTDLIDRLDIDPGTGKVFVGNSLSIAHHLSYHSDKLLVANNDGDISRIILMNGGTSIDSNTDQSLTIYPDRINVLKKDKVQDRLYAYGDDGLIYLLNGLGDTFEPIKNNINKNIYNAVSSDFNMCFVGEKGLAKVGSTNGNVLNHFDLKLSFSQTVSSTFGNTDFHGVELASNNRLYIVGEYGAFLYNPNFGDFTGNDFVTIVNQENINLWDVSELSGTGNVFISGNNGLIQKQYGSTGIVNQQLFIPSIKDIHFKDGASATIVADNFVVRTTSNGGGSWKIALPQGSIAPTATYDKVWTLDNGKSLLLGNGNTLVHDRNSGITGTAFNSTHVRAVGKGSNNDNIFIVDDLSIKRVNLSTLASIPISTLTSPAQANAIHTFTNGDHIVVGNNGLYKHFNAGGVEISSSTGISSSVNFNDVAFKDHINGIIVGDDGIYYQTKNQTISPTGYMSNTNWELKNLIGIDPLGVNNANIYSLAIASSVDILIGGENPSANSGAQYPYVRKIYDAGGRYSNRFYYDKLGRLVVSQNARQEASTSSALNGKYSYTLYDELGRVIEVGEKTENTGSGELQFKTVFGANVGGVFNPSTIDDMRLKLWVDGSGARSEVTKSYYDKPIINGLPSAIVADVHTQRQRIVHVTYEEIFDGDDQTFDHATHYSYDIHGNVETLLQDNKKMEDNFPSLASQRFKRMDYSYDLLSGNVHRMSVQNGESDQWHHAYVYDADNRIEKVYTNTRSPLTEMNRLTQNKEIELSHNAVGKMMLIITTMTMGHWHVWRLGRTIFKE